MGLILIIVVIAIVVALLAPTAGRGFFTGTHTPATTTETPLEILNKRYARGEIDRVEYESRKRDLSA